MVEQLERVCQEDEQSRSTRSVLAALCDRHVEGGSLAACALETGAVAARQSKATREDGGTTGEVSQRVRSQQSAEKVDSREERRRRQLV